VNAKEMEWPSLRVLRLGREPDAPWVTSTGPRQAHLDGFDLHANLLAPAEDRVRLEQLCRYLLRPLVAQDRLRLTSDGPYGTDLLHAQGVALHDNDVIIGWPG
jgi:hypothetical protein